MKKKLFLVGCNSFRKKLKLKILNISKEYIVKMVELLNSFQILFYAFLNKSCNQMFFCFYVMQFLFFFPFLKINSSDLLLKIDIYCRYWTFNSKKMNCWTFEQTISLILSLGNSIFSSSFKHCIEWFSPVDVVTTCFDSKMWRRLFQSGRVCRGGRELIFPLEMFLCYYLKNI